MRPIARYGFLGNVRKLLSQATFFIDAKEATVGQTASNLGTGGSVLDAQYGSTTGADTNDPLLLEHTGTNYLYLPGVAGNVASTPDTAAVSVTGSIDIRVRVALDDWSPSATGVLIAKDTAGAGGRSWSIDMLNNGGLRFLSSQDGSTMNVNVASTVLPGVSLLVDGRAYWLRVTLDVPNTTVTFYMADDSPTVPTTWSQIGTPVASGATTGIADTAAALTIGGRASDVPVAGKFYRAQVLNGIGGTVVFDADFTTGITSGGQTTFTESSSNAATVTINRSTSGRKSVAVVRDVWLFGTDDYMQVADNDLLDFGASDSFTVVAVVRQWTSAGGHTLLAKANNATATMLGYLINNNATPAASNRYGDGTNRQLVSDGMTLTMGALQLRAMVRNTVADNHVSYVGTTAGTVGTDTTTGTLANSSPLSVGRVDVGSYADMELLAVAIFRRALSADEIASIANYYGAT
jgi:hypothetical protein